MCLHFKIYFPPKLFNVLVDVLKGALTRQGVTFVLHYLDELLTLDTSAFNICQENLSIIRYKSPTT